MSLLVLTIGVPDLCANEPIAVLTGFTREVLIRSRGSWAVEPRQDLLLDSQDEVVTRLGNAIVTFNDGAT